MSCPNCGILICPDTFFEDYTCPWCQYTILAKAMPLDRKVAELQQRVLVLERKAGDPA